MFWTNKNPTFNDVASNAYIILNKYGFDGLQDYLPEELPNIEKGCKLFVKAIGTVDGWKASVISSTPARVWFQNIKTKEINYYYNFDVALRRKIDAKIQKQKSNIKFNQK